MRYLHISSASGHPSKQTMDTGMRIIFPGMGGFVVSFSALLACTVYTDCMEISVGLCLMFCFQLLNMCGRCSILFLSQRGRGRGIVRALEFHRLGM